ncbi:hypothetical protein BDV96DRAFT_222180 [Lophiotrema nucula]|uniref:Uncharacterized protein n=1 Tax=Lophiotrema nucula TaxID=690887 RepID=A0A6A5YVL8_9PLEO|nr:hypothetical protein BDV96DRAFT_222180 [Lophiotrema nucula]
MIRNFMFVWSIPQLQRPGHALPEHDEPRKMPIPSLNLALKPRHHIAKTKNAPSTSESSRLAQTDNAAYSSDALRLDSSNNNARPNAASLPAKDVDAKRRSFLPQRGDARQLPRQKPTEEEGTKEERPTYSRQNSSNASARLADTQPMTQRSRPKSLYQVHVNRTERCEGNGEPRAQTLRAPHAASKLAQPRSTGLNRSQSLRKPSAQTEQKLDRDVHTSLHTRSQSTITVARGEEVELRPRSERPRSLYVTSYESGASIRNASADTVPSDAKPSVRSIALSRSVSTRMKSEVVGSSDSTSLARGDQYARTSMIQRREPVRDDSKKPVKPAFSTLQQHFTPRKVGKAPTSMFLHPPVQDVGPHVLPPELYSLQAQLLQFHLLHQASAETNTEWEQSAMKGLRNKFDQVASFYEAMRDNERQDQEQKNLQALHDWNNGNSSFSLVDYIQLLSGPLHEIPSLLQPGGRLGRLADDFDDWLVWVQDVHSARAANATRRGGGFESAESLGDSWKSENAALTRKLTAFTRDLDRMSQPTPGSSMACIVATCRELLGLILDELHAMQMIEADVVAAEKEWVEAQLRAVECDIGGQLQDDSENVAWRL